MMRPTPSGFTLIEVLVSLFVLAVGVIGMAGLQLSALRTVQQSSFQTIALELASEIAEKIRANAGQMKQGNTTNPFLQIDYKSADSADPDAPAKMCFNPSASCDADELAEFDIYEWKKRLKAALPGGRALICRDASPWDSSADAFTWNCDGSGAATNTAPVVIKIGWQGKNPDGSLLKDAGGQFPPSVVMAVDAYKK